MSIDTILVIMIGGCIYLLNAALYTAHIHKQYGSPDDPAEMLLLEGMLGLMWPMLMLVEFVGQLGKWIYEAINQEEDHANNHSS